jgi:gamma-aminobutyric acid type B receptor
VQWIYILKVRIWTLSIGFTISFGAIFSKTWRVHTIFTNVNASKRVNNRMDKVSKDSVRLFLRQLKIIVYLFLLEFYSPLIQFY